MSRVLIVDPPSGWKYGFPLPLPSGKDYLELLREQGYPEKDLDLALKHSRYWEKGDEEIGEVDG